MSERIAVLASPKSGANRRFPKRLERLRAMADRHGARFVAPAGLDALATEVRALADAGITLLAVNGGDGTLHRVITAAASAYGEDSLPQIAILPGGTMNIAARSTGWLGKPELALARVFEGGLAVRPTSLLRVDGQWYGFLWGNGLIASFLELYEEVPDPTALRAATILGRGAASALVGGPFAAQLTRRWRGTVEIDGQMLDRDDWLAVAAGTVEQIGLGFRPFRFTEQGPGRMHAVGLGCAVGRFARELPRVYARQPLLAPENVERSASRLVLRGVEPATFMVDGDFHRGGHELVVDVGPTVALRVPGNRAVTDA